MADLEHPEQELTPGYYDNQFGNRLGDLRKPGAEPPAASGGTATGGGCLKGGGGILFGVVLLMRLLFSFLGRDSSASKYNYPTTVPAYTPPPQVQPFNPGVRDMRGNQFNDDLNVPPARPGLRFQDGNEGGLGRLPGGNLPRNRGGLGRPGDLGQPGVNPPGLVPPKPKAEDETFDPVP